MIYRSDAFDHYDTIFCVGPHHEAEIREREKLTSCKPKALFQHGYGRIDDIIAGTQARAPVNDGPAHVLVAPSWGPHGIFETLGRKLVQVLLDAGFAVTVRPHPKTVEKAASKIKELRQVFRGNKRFALETDMAAKASLYRSDVMICDWSGAAFEYAFGMMKPVVFLDTPRKVNNPHYAALGIEPMEAALRSEIGHIVSPSELDALPKVIDDVIGVRNAAAEPIVRVRDKWLFNVGRSATVGAAELVRIAGRLVSVDVGVQFDVETAARDTAAYGLKESSDCESSLQEGRVAPWLAELVARSEEGYAARDLAALERFCRKTDVFRKVARAYDSTFHKLIDPTPLAWEAYPALVFALIAGARQAARSDRGLALKLLNSASNALNIYVGVGRVAAAPLLESLIHRHCESLGLSA